MKSKNLTFVEQYLEKIVLGAAILFFIIVCWFFVLSSPYRAELKSGKELRDVGPREVESVVDEHVEKLARAITSSFSRLPPMTVPKYADDFQARMSALLLPNATLPLPLDDVGIDLLGSGSGNELWPRYAVPLPPAPLTPLVVTGHAVLAEVDDPPLMEQYVSMIGDATPRDFRYCSVSADFDPRQWVDALKGSHEPQIPEEWWRGLMLIIHVRLEREKLDPATGQWIERTVIPVMPGTPRIKNTVEEKITIEEAQEQVRKIRASQQSIRQQAFPDLAVGVWIPPGVNASEINYEKLTQLAQVIRAIEENERKLASLSERAAAPSAGNRNNGSQPISLNRPNQNRFSPEGENTRGVDPITALDQQSLLIKQEIRRLIRSRDSLLAGVDPASGVREGDVSPPSRGKPRGQDDRAAEQPDESLESFTLTAHDPTVKPGCVYRYRVIAGVFNPLFQRNQVDRKQQKEMRSRLSIDSLPSPWSEKVAVEPEQRFFLVGSSPDLRRSTWEIWRIFNGKWISSTFHCSPGDPIGGFAQVNVDGVAAKLDMAAESILIDLDNVEDQNGQYKSVKAIILDIASGKLLEKIRSDENEDALRQSLLHPNTPPGKPVRSEDVGVESSHHPHARSESSPLPTSDDDSN